MAAAEYIVVCIDNSAEAYNLDTYEPQIDAAKHYCKTKLNANTETKVTLNTMSSKNSQMMQPATSDFQEILDYLPSIRLYAGLLWFRAAINCALVALSNSPPNKRKRILFLVGGLIDLDEWDLVKYGSKLRDTGVAVDVVNFYLGKKPKHTTINNQFGRKELDAFVEVVNSKDNSHIVHVKPGSSISEVLSESILRKTPRLSRRTNHDHHKKATGKNHVTGDNKRVPSETLSLENERVKLGKRKALSFENEGVKLGKRKALSFENEGVKLGKRKDALNNKTSMRMAHVVD